MDVRALASGPAPVTSRLTRLSPKLPSIRPCRPQATYAKLTVNQVFDPKSPNAGVASPLFDIAGNAFTAALNNEVDAQTAVDEMKQGLEELQ